MIIELKEQKSYELGDKANYKIERTKNHMKQYMQTFSRNFLVIKMTFQRCKVFDLDDDTY
jgi:hypothetical protein